MINPRVRLKPAPKKRVNKRELAKGIKVEMEHTRSRRAAEIIARQHLAELPNYYTLLLAMEKKAMRKNPIPVAVAEALPYESDFVLTDEFLKAVENTKDAEITSKGLLIKLTRCQKPEQHDQPSLRTAVFYLPVGDKRLTYYKKKGSWYGGQDCITGDTLLKRPLIVKGATGGKVPEAALKFLTGDKKAPAKLDEELRNYIVLRWGQSRSDLLPQVQSALDSLGGNSVVADEIVEFSTEGNTLNYAVRENIICTMARKAGYDSIVGWSHGSKTGYFISEVIDLREQFYPSPWGAYSIHRSFKTQRNPVVPLPPDFFPRLAKQRDELRMVRDDIYKRTGVWMDDLAEVRSLLSRAEVTARRKQIRVVGGKMKKANPKNIRVKLHKGGAVRRKKNPSNSDEVQTWAATRSGPMQVKAPRPI